MKLDKLIQEVDRKRKAKRLSFVDLSKIGGCSSSAVGKWFSGCSNVSQTSGIVALNRICDFLKVNPRGLISTEDFSGRLTMLSFLNRTDFSTLSKNARLAETCVAAWVLGSAKPQEKSIKKLADYCGVTPEWILYGDNKPKYGLIDLPAVEEKAESVVFTAKPKAQTGNFIKLDNGMIADISTGKTFTIYQFNQLFEVQQ